MTESTTSGRRERSRAARVTLLAAGAVAALVAVGLIAVGGFTLWGDAQKDERGYVSTDGQRFAAAGHALATESLDLELDGVEGLVDSTDLGDVRLEVHPESDKPVFVGIARTPDASSYLSNVSHTTVTDLEYDPFEASYSSETGERKPAAPGGERIWAASAQGPGAQTLEWEAEDGDWSVVVMNADGSRGVGAEVSAGAKLPYLTEIGWSALGAAAILLLAAATLAAFAIRPPRNRSRKAPNPRPAPSAS
jgi:hypothetical protein